MVWAIAAQVDPQRDLFLLENTPFDSLDFASEYEGLGGRLAIDATTKIGPEKRHPWGQPLGRTSDQISIIDDRWSELGLDDLENSSPDPTLFGYVLDKLIKNQPFQKI